MAKRRLKRVDESHLRRLTFEVDDELKAEFTRACKNRGITMKFVATRLIKDWIYHQEMPSTYFEKIGSMHE